MASTDELACTYSALILADDDVPITAEKIASILKAANCKVEAYWPSLFSKALTNISVKDLITNIGNVAASAGPAAAASASAATDAPVEEKKEEKKEESEEEEDDDMGFGLFD